jgi:hypothetical protein
MKRLFALATLLAACIGRAGAEPAVLVLSPVHAPRFAENLDTGRPLVEKELAAKLVELTRAHFPVFIWQTTAASPAPEAQLILALTEEKGAGLWSEVRLSWSAKVGTTVLDMPDLKAIPVYGSLEGTREMHDPVKLGAILKAKLAAWFGESSNRLVFSKSFVNFVPLARSVRVEREHKSIALPFLMSSAKVDRHSKLEVRFVANANGAANKGVILVSNLFEGMSNARRQTLGAVSTFQFASADVVSGWSPQIPGLLQNPVQSLLFFEDYIFSPAGAVSDGLMGVP